MGKALPEVRTWLLGLAWPGRPHLMLLGHSFQSGREGRVGDGPGHLEGSGLGKVGAEQRGAIKSALTRSKNCRRRYLGTWLRRGVGEGMQQLNLESAADLSGNSILGFNSRLVVIECG